MGKRNDDYNGHGDMELAAGSDLAAGDLDQYLIENEAEAWGINLRDASHKLQKCWSEQERFLAAFRTGGTIKAGLSNVKVCRRTAELWKEHDLLRFRERFLAAHETFVDSQENILYALNEGLKPGQVPTGLLATLNANRSEKWRQNVAVTHEVGREVMATLKKLQEQSQSELPEGDTRPGMVDGESRVLPGD